MHFKTLWPLLLCAASAGTGCSSDEGPGASTTPRGSAGSSTSGGSGGRGSGVGGSGVEGGAGGSAGSGVDLDAAPVDGERDRGVDGTTADGAQEAASGDAGVSVGTMVPLYTNPGDPSWIAIVTAKKAHPTVPVVAVVNPSNGPGTRADSGYTTGIDQLLGAGIRVIGYVSTSYTMRGEPAVNADVDRWQMFYPNISGVFFDEQSSTPGGEDFYRHVSQYAKTKGLAFTVGNPGTDTTASYIDTVDMMLIYESAGVPPLNRLQGWHQAYDRTHFGIIPYGTPLDQAFVQSAKAYVGYIYLTDDTLPNPWDSLPAYFDQLLGLLGP
jgi:Spherulation-specific family 4